MMVLVVPHQERDFKNLVEKTKIVEEVKCLECEKRDKARWTRKDRPRQNVATVADGGKAQNCATCGKRHPGECWRSLGAYLRSGSLDHKIKDFPLCTEQMQAPE
ncbi:ATP-dependent zinc metalloprotease FtsH [Gossypium australe]|uniref:ATP-dependent zinc metalloprotease FtsH n=1 Tax=Gossypium australe TaxID=47621 RepID=A0A5B6VN49_9ROSI|nr:ATP-dependent zinc metalloprotease FtsH [Gossypium australe]